MKQEALKVESVSKVYRTGEQQVSAVIDVSLSLYQGEILALLGPNGAGKSTLIKMILNLVKPTEGRISLNGKSVRNNPGIVGKTIGYLPERINFYPNLTAKETLKYFAALKKVPQQKAEEALELVGLKDKLDYKVGGFSKGMLQRLGLAQAIMGSPPVLIMDEPTSGLDPLVVREYKEIIKKINSFGTSILFSSHVLSVAGDLADRSAIMYRGKLVAMYELGSDPEKLDLEEAFFQAITREEGANENGYS